ncbi:Alpha-galactosidase [Erythrobacter sp. NAP1]|uniref:alpha-galactosidase n=1 Tax=Erythrobacter sp. NAP1 TaxID=237727 RepID=UPI000068522E|nr:alpha-galactosidase [Erythrobacter sp. NAP1]EAQ27700.1 Alpha-galactosidase [Erythrobacter sp. NAP1]
MSRPVDDNAGWFELRAGGTLIAFEAAVGERAHIVYAGPDIVGASAAELALLATRQHAPGGPAVHQRGSLLHTIGTGISGPAGLIGHRGGKDWAVDLRVVSVETHGPASLSIRCEHANSSLSSIHSFALDTITGLLTTSTEITNNASEPFELEWCSALCLPIDQRLSRYLSFTGRWANEFQVEEVPAFQGSIVRENKAGRTSHDVYPGGILAAARTGETSGLALGFHLAWSGNHRQRIDRHSDGRGFVQLGEMFFPGEMRLAEGESYRTPDMLAAWSMDGLNGVSHAFHDHLQEKLLDKRAFAKPRPVHYNTWEAVYFNHNEATLLELAERAADVGAERFVLDDGWFGSRRNDAAGLGDWWVSKDVYPNGLHPIADRVRDLGMEFGLWFEPEMVNPESELYRAHPDWVLGVDSVEPIASRNQLTLDLTNPAVTEYLFECINALVEEYDIAYIKWDMNRDAQHPASGGRAVMHRQTRAVYALIERLRTAHPGLEIESCSSGGARADFGILRHTDRVWTSDNNDAHHRHSIMRGASHFLPLRVLGNHVGPKTCHITGRRFSMAFRVASAIFGHMGMELDLRREIERDLNVLKAGIALHKQHRNLIHLGRFWRGESGPNSNLVGCVAKDATEALFAFTVLDLETAPLPARIIFPGLDPAKSYRIKLVWPPHNPSISSPSIIDAAKLQGEGTVVSGAALTSYGIQPPLTRPDTCLIYHLKSCE